MTDPTSDTTEKKHVVILGKDAAISDFPDDAIYEEGPMVDGKRNGDWKRYYASGQMRSQIHYTDDAPFGAYKLYTESGSLMEEGRWEHGLNVGHLRRYWPNGTLQQLLTFDEFGVGQGQQRYFHNNGQLEMLVELKDGQEEGDLVRLDREGRVVNRTTYLSGRIVQRAD
jgi:antitoxin component YwqK of YwqJK toxin-antitoxin module